MVGFVWLADDVDETRAAAKKNGFSFYYPKCLFFMFCFALHFPFRFVLIGFLFSIFTIYSPSLSLARFFIPMCSVYFPFLFSGVLLSFLWFLSFYYHRLCDMYGRHTEKRRHTHRERVERRLRKKWHSFGHMRGICITCSILLCHYNLYQCLRLWYSSSL